MADTPKHDVDEDLVRQMTRLLEETGLNEIEYGRDGWHVRVVKGGAQVAAAAVPAAVSAPAPAGGLETLVDAANAVASPMVGVVYTRPEPDQPDFVKVGDTVEEGQTLLLIEAMKVFNPITAPRAGRVKEVLVTNGAPVEYGEPLLILE